ncbi:MAG: hypothetical protein IPH53_12170 [Flavobacteriales bacterium]|nr:hypothetical protein [Flavobacteriales bacterium]
MSRSGILVFLLATVLGGCRKDEEEVTQADVVMMIDHAVAEKGILPLFAHLQSLRLGPGRWSPTGEVPCIALDSITGDTAAFPMNGPVTAFLRFFSQGCLGLDGVQRNGAIVVHYDTTIAGQAMVSGFSAADLDLGLGHFRFGATVEAQNVTTSTVHLDSSFVHSSGAWSERFRGVVSYSLLNAPLDSVVQSDRYSVLFDLVGKDHNGRAYGTVAVAGLELDVDCAWITKGEETFTVEDAIERRMDHGQGCDGRVELHAGEQVVGLTIP